MTCIIETKSKRHVMTRLAAGLAISAILVLVSFVAPASAAEQRGGGGGGHAGGGHAGGGHGGGGRGGGYRGGYRGGYGGGYYVAPPVIYGSPYVGSYCNGYSPPLVYGPCIGLDIY